MKFQAIVAPTISELFERQIQSMILSGQVSPGDKLPTEAELAEELNISKSAVHAGVKNLERMGFLRVMPRHGVYVDDYTQSGNMDTLIALLKFHGGRLDKNTMTSLLEARETLEGLAMRKFIDRRSDADIRELESIIARVREAGRQPRPDTESIAELACLFHSYICAKSGNNVIPMIVNGFHDVNIALWTMWAARVRAEEVAEILEEFLYYIKVKDPNSTMELFRRSARDFLAMVE